MDPHGHIYEGTKEKPVKPEDAARLDGYLRARAEADKGNEVEALKAEMAREHDRMEAKAAHPVWSSDNEAIKEEFRRLEADRDLWQRWHEHADSQADRLQAILDRSKGEGQ